LYVARYCKNRIQKIGRGHVYNEKVDGFSHGSRLVDNYSDDDISTQGNEKKQAVSEDFSEAFSCRTVAAA